MSSSSRLNSILALEHAPAKAVDLAPSDRSTSVDQDLAVLRKCVSDLGYTLDSLEASMGKNRAHIGRVLNGEKPMSHEFQIGLPDDLEALYRQRQAEALGLIVVAPVDEETARRHLVSGLFGVLAPQRRRA